MRVINAYTIRPCDIQPGDVMMFIVKALMVAPGRYRLYRCPYGGGSQYGPLEAEDLPQGSRLGEYEDFVCEELFPSLAVVATSDR